MQPGKDLSNLDFIRSVAVLLVVDSHISLYSRQLYIGPWAGLVGVYIFFVHTSFVLMASLERDPHPGRFYLRRIFRIYPLWLFVLALVLIVHLPSAPMYPGVFRFYKPDLGELIANILLAFDFRYGTQVVGGSWTLPVEVHMYLILPFLFFFVRGTRKLWPLFVLDFFAMGLSHSATGVGSLLLLSAPCFFPGVISYFLSKRWKPRLPGWSFVLTFAALVVLMCHYGSPVGGWFLTLALGLLLPIFKQIPWRTFNRVTHLIARYSYGIYLGHFFAIVVAVHLLQGHNLFLRVAAFLAIIVAMPVAMYHFIEAPMIKLGSRLARKIEDGPEPPADERMMSLEPAP